VQLSVPAPVFSLVRTGFACARSLPEEAREAIKVVRSASVGVFEHGGPDADLAGDALVPAADAAMARRGWTRVVGVRDGGNTVLIYLPDGRADTKPSRVCLAVCDGQHLVVVSAVISADAIADLVAHELDKHGSVRL